MKGGLSWEGQFSDILLSQYIWNLFWCVGHWWEGPFKRGTNALYLCKYVKNLIIFGSLGQNVVSCKRLLNLTNYLQCRFINFNWISVCFHVVQKDYSGHSTAAGHRVNWPSNWISPRLLYFEKCKRQNESKIQLCFAYWFCRIPPSTLELSRPTWKWVESHESQWTMKSQFEVIRTILYPKSMCKQNSFSAVSQKSTSKKI